MVGILIWPFSEPLHSSGSLSLNLWPIIFNVQLFISSSGDSGEPLRSGCDLIEGLGEFLHAFEFKKSLAVSINSAFTLHSIHEGASHK